MAASAADKAAKRKLYYEKNRERILAANRNRTLSPAAQAHRDAYNRAYVLRPEVKQRTSVYRKAWATRHYGSPERYSRHAAYMKRYGIDIETYERMMEEQNHRCKLCGRQRDKRKRLAVDHDHATGRVRGLLCTFCNLMVGRIDADQTLASRLQEYCYGDI
jgi:Recombination endonuclease VII